MPMTLPHADLSRVDRDKVCRYLLKTDHRYGAAKARFFSQFGFSADAWEDMARALREHGRCHPVVSMAATGFGTRYEVDGDLSAPDGRQPRVRTVWHVDTGTIAPRLITAYPLKRVHR